MFYSIIYIQTRAGKAQERKGQEMDKIGKLVYEEEGFEVYQIRGHFEVYRNGKWFGSADTLREALQDIVEEMKKEY